MRIFLKSIPILILLFVCSNPLFAQDFDEQKEKADEYFEAGLYQEASQIYASILSNKPKDYELNFKHGACLLYTSHNKAEAIKFLKYSIKSPSIDKRAYFFLGRAYHLNYQFKDAEVYYKKFQEQASTKQKKDFPVDAMLDACKYGRTLLSDITDMIVMKKTEIAEESFYSLYDLTTIGGTILATTDDEFMTKFDGKQGHKAIIHFPANSPNIFYSSYGDDGATGLDIYQKKKLPNGKYSLPQKVRGSVNTDLDEDYAYMDPKGEYLYFCSKGHNSMGGYDVFRSKYDPKTDAFGPPENMDFAISSPDDDLLYIVDAEGNVAFFASKRESSAGKVFVYEVRVEKIPLQIAAIKGTFVNNIVASNKEVNILVEDFSSGREIGEFNSRGADGEYFMVLPKGGKYKFYITVKGSDVTHYAVVDVPKLKELRPLKQRITLLRDENGEQIIQIDNLFDEIFEDPVTVMAEIYQNLSMLEPNAENFDLDSLNAQKDVDKVFSDNGLDGFSTKSDVEFVLESEIEDIKEDIEKDKELSNISYNMAAEIIDEANEKLLEVNKLMDEADNASDPKEKNRLYKEADKLNKEVKQLNDDAQNLIELGKKIDQEIADKETTLKKAEQVLEDVKQVPDSDRALLADQVDNNKEFFVENIKDRESKLNTVEQIISDGRNSTVEANNINKEIIRLTNDKKQLEKDKAILDDRLANTKKKKDREVIEDQIDEIEAELNIVNDQINVRQKDYDVLIKDETNPLNGAANIVVDDDNKVYNVDLNSDQKIDISNKVKSGDVSSDVALIDDEIKANGGGSRVDMFASDEQRESYSLEQWKDDIDKEIKNLRDDLNTASPEERVRIEQLIQDYENLKDKKIQEFDVVDNTNDKDFSINPEDIVNDFDSEYQNKINSIYENVDEGDRDGAIRDLNNGIISSTNEKIQEYEAILEDDPSNQNAKSNLDNLVAFKEKVERNIGEPIIDPLLIDPSNIETRVEADQLVEGYESRLKQIDDMSNEHDKRDAENTLKKELSDEIRNEIAQLDKILADDPGNKDAKKRSDNLKKLDDQINKDIVDNQDWLADNPRDNSNTNVADVALVNPDYKRELNDIYDNKIGSDREDAIKELNRSTVDDINDRLNDINYELIEDPDNSILQNEKIELTNLKNQIENNPETALIDPDLSSEVNVDPSIADIMPSYESNRNAIDAQAESPVKEKNKINLNNQLISQIDNEIDKLNNLKSDRPDLSGDIDKRINKLNSIKSQKEGENKTSQDIIDGNIDASDVINTNPSIEEIMPSYPSERENIDAQSQSNEKEQNKINLNNQLINEIEAEIEQLENLKSEKPELTNNIDDRIKALNFIKGEKERENKTSQDIIDGNIDASDVINTNPSIAEIMPSYPSERENIDGQEQSNEKEQNKIDLNNQLISEIDSEINKLNTLKSDRPELSSDIELRINKLNSIKSQKESENKTSQDIIDGNIDASDLINTNPSIAEIMPSYPSERENIDGQEQSNEKEQNKINLNNQLIGEIEAEIEKLENLKSEKPELTTDIDERIKALNFIKGEKERENQTSQDIIDGNEVTNDIAVNPNPSIDEIMPDYTAKMDNVDRLNIENIEKENQRINVNRELINKIDNEIDLLNNLKGSNPELSADIESRIDALNGIKSDKEGEIAASQLIVDGGTTTTDPTNTNNNANETELLAMSAVPTVSEISPEYDNDMDNIRLSVQDESVKEQRKIDLNKDLINKIDNEINRLNNLKEKNPDFIGKIDQRIQGLNNMKAAKEDEIKASENTISGPDLANRAVISIGSLMPSYESDLSDVRNNDVLPETEKLTEENELHQALIGKINNKISDLQEEWEENPELQEVIDEEIQKLEELKESKRNEISRNNDLIDQLSDNADSGNRSVEDLTVDNYDSDSGKEAIENNQGNIEQIKAYNEDIAALENEKENADSQKEKDKLDKKINKTKIKQAKVSNQVIEDLEAANVNEFENEKDKAEVDAYVATANNPNDEDIQSANKDIEDANRLMQEAKDLREQAANEKDPIKANDLLKEALSKENEAKDKMNKAGKTFKTARVVNNFNENTEEVIVKVDDNPENRLSTDYFEQADQLDVKANGFANRAQELRDSSETVKKKYRQAIVNDANEMDKKAEQLRVEANNVREKGNDLKEQEDDILANKIPDSNSNPDDETVGELSTDESYKSFYDAQMSAEENLGKANELEAEINAVKDQQKRKIKNAVVTYQDGDEVSSTLNNDPDIQRDQEKIDSLTALQKEYRDKAMQDLETANDILNESDDQVKDDYIAMSNNNVGPRDENMIGPPDSLAADYQAPSNLVTDIFRTTEEPIYDETKTIPVDQKTSGLVYKVQVGAFRNPLPQDHFKEFAPISGQKLDNGITRYMAGYFTKEVSANSAKSQIGAKGYNDAFVVAYCNGERISIADARKIERGEIDCPGTANSEDFVNNSTNTNDSTTNWNTNGGNGTNTGLETDGNAEVNPSNNEEENLVSYYTDFPDAAKANQVEIVKGLFFTVQIGVYSKPVEPEVLFNIQPLNSQKTESGTIRYSTGMFSSIPTANERKSEVREIGVQDAFVTAYFNGERISISDANKLLEENGPSVLFNSAENAKENFGTDVVDTDPIDTDPIDTDPIDTDPIDTDPIDTDPIDTDPIDTDPIDTDPIDTDPIDTDPIDTDPTDTDGVFNTSKEDKGPPYRINLGYFEEGVPVEFTDLLLNNQNEGILSVSNMDDYILYFVGNYESRQGAEDRLKDLESRGFKDAYIVSIKEDEEVENEQKYYKEGVYYRVKLGRFKGEIPGEYATIMLQTENLLETEEDVEGNTYLLSNKISSMSEMESTLTEFSELGFESMEIVSYYQYDAIPFAQAQKILNDEPIGVLQKYEHHEGIDADPYLYHKEAIYFHVQVGKFYREVPTEFTNLLFENADENILQEETFDEEWLFFTENIYSYEEAEEIKAHLISIGFSDAVIIAFHKYTRISIDKALKILEH